MALPFIGASKTANKGYDQVFGYIFGYTTDPRDPSRETTLQYKESNTSGLHSYYYYIPSSLREVTISGGKISKYAFNNCRRLISVIIGNGGAIWVNEYAFSNCTGLTSIIIPNGVTLIDNYAFYNCSGLTSITIPNSVTSIGYEAFYNCSGLISITIPNSVTSIGDYAFSRCSELTNINFKGTIAQWKAISKGNDWKYNIPSTCKVYCTDGTISINA